MDRDSGMSNTAGNNSLSHRDANCAAEAFMLLLRGRSSSSTKTAYMSLSYCAIAAVPLQVSVSLSWAGQRWGNNKVAKVLLKWQGGQCRGLVRVRMILVGEVRSDTWGIFRKRFSG